MIATAGLNRERLIRLIAERHGIRVDQDDPLFAVGTIFEAHLDEAARCFDELMQHRIADFEVAVGRVQQRAGQLLGEEFNERVAALRNELQKDITLAGAKANEFVFRVEQAHRQPVIFRWGAAGLIAALVLFAAGLWIGTHYLCSSTGI